MSRTTHVFIAGTYVAAAVFIAAVMVRVGGVSFSTAWTWALLVALAAGQMHAIFARGAERDRLVEQVAQVRAAGDELACQLRDARQELRDVRRTIAEEGEVRATALAAEMKTLEGLVVEMADRVDERIRQARMEATRALQTPSVDRSVMLGAIRDALTDGRVDLHLQPIVALPSRRVRYYESFTRLRDVDGRMIMPPEWLRVAEEGGMMSAIDNLLLFRCVQIVRKLSARERRVAIFCNISASSLSDDRFFPEFHTFMRQHADLADAIVFELSQDAFVGLSKTAAGNLERLADLGFRISLDAVHDLGLDLPALREAGVSHVKVAADLLLTAVRPGEPVGLRSAPDICGEDFAAILARHGIQLVAERIEDEKTTISVLELFVPFAQGHLFGAPRPIKPELLGEAEGQALPDAELRPAAA